MYWVLISGSWRTIDLQVKNNVRHTVQKLLEQNKGIITGGALGVDYIATNQVIKHDSSLKQLKVFLPTSLNIYSKHYFKRARKGVITTDQAKQLIDQLTQIQKVHPRSLIENDNNKIVNQKTYYQRITSQVDAASELIAFHVNQSAGTQFTISTAKKKKIPIITYRYQIPS